MNQTYQSITLAAGESLAINKPGRVFACDTATADFALRVENQAEITASAKRVFGSSTSPTFNRLTIRNTSGAGNTIVFAISFQDIKIESQVASIVATITATGKNSPTYTKGSSATLGAGATQAFTGSAGVNVRKSFSVFNTHATDDLNIRGANGTLMHVVAARTGFVVESGGSITLHVPGAAAITYAVCEVFYS